MTRKPRPWPQPLLPWFTLGCLGLLMALGKGYETTLRGIDSNIHAAVSMSVTSGGSWLPRLPIPYAEWPRGVFNDHPFTLFWLNGWVMRALGPSAFSARLLTALFAMGSVILTALIGARWRGPVFGLLAGIFLATTRDWVFTVGTMSLDPALVFFILLSFWYWVGARPLAAGVAAGFGLWVKTPIVLLLFPVALLAAVVQKKIKKTLPALALSLGVAVALGAAFWGLTAALGGWEMVRDYWARQVWGTSVGGRGAPDHQWLFFFSTLKLGALPWLPFLIWSLVVVVRKKEWRKEEVLLPLLATGCVALPVTLMRFKLGHYFTPVFPFLALLSARPIVAWCEKRESKFYAAFTAVTLVLTTFLVVAPVPLAPEAFVALSKFEAYIDRVGDCGDEVWLVPGGEPVGSAQDYQLHLAFYTGRKTQVVECAQLGARLKSARPKWLVIAHENLKCLPEKNREASFVGALLVGSQYLFGRDLKTGPVTDLTPLHTEGLAVGSGCAAAAYPRDTWHRYVE